MSDGDLIQRLNAVHDGLLNNPAYPNPSVDLAAFKTAIDAYTAAVAAALEGGKSALALRDKRRADVVAMLRSLGHFVEGASKNDMTTFLSSGFVAATTGRRNPSVPVDVPSINRVDQGSTGQLLVTIQPVANARHYQLRYALDPAAGTQPGWTTIDLPSTQPAITINKLTRGASYTFQVRAYGKLGYSDWSAPAERMCI